MRERFCFATASLVVICWCILCPLVEAQTATVAPATDLSPESRPWSLNSSAAAATANNASVDSGTALATGIEEIIVTARRKEESLQTVPVAITAISGADLREHNIENMYDLEQLAPSLSVTTTSRGGNTPIYAIRGVRGFATSALVDPPITVYFGEVGQSIPTGTNSELFDLQSVQVLRGPQGTLFGRNTTGGAIVITPQKPSDKFEGYGQVTAGDYGYSDYEGALNLPVDDKLFVRIAGKITRRDGYLDDVSTGQYADDIHTASYRASVRWLPIDGVESTFVGTYFYSGGAGNGLKLIVFDPAGLPALGPLTPIVAGSVQSALSQSQALGRYQIDSSIPLYARDKVGGIQNITTADLGAITLKNIFGYRTISDAYSFSGDGSSAGVVSTYPASVTTDQVSDELQVLGKVGKFDYVAGLFYYHENAEDKATFPLFRVLAPVVPAVFPLDSIQDFGARNSSYAAYAHGSYDLGSMLDGLSLSAGVRYTGDERGVIYHSRAGNGIDPSTAVCTLTGQTIPINSRSACATSETKYFGEPTYDATISYQIDPNLLIYLAHRRGYRTGGFNTTPLVPLVPPPTYAPEIIKDAELGAKSDFHIGQVQGRLDVAAYYDWYSNIQRSGEVLGAGGSSTTLTVNAAKAHIYGSEVELTLKPVRSVTLSFGYAYTRPIYDQWDDHYVVNGVLTPIDISGSQFAYIPENQVNASARFEVPVPGRYGVPSLQLSYYYQSNIQTGEVNTTNCGIGGAYTNCLEHFGALPSYGLLNLRADWTNVMNKGFDFAFFINNLTNKFYMPDDANLLGVFGIAAASIGPPRMFGFQVRVPFGAAR